MSLVNLNEKTCNLCGKIGENDSKIDYGICDHQPLCTTCVDINHGTLRSKSCTDCGKMIHDTILYQQGALKVSENINNKCCCVCSERILIGETFDVCKTRPVVDACSICFQCKLDYGYHRILEKFCMCKDKSKSSTPYRPSVYQKRCVMNTANVDSNLDEVKDELVNGDLDEVDEVQDELVNGDLGEVDGIQDESNKENTEELMKIIESNTTLIEQLTQENASLMKELKQTRSCVDEDLDDESSIVFDTFSSSSNSSNHNRSRMHSLNESKSEIENRVKVDPKKINFFYELSKSRPSIATTLSISPTVAISGSEGVTPPPFIISRIRKFPINTSSIKNTSNPKKRRKRTFSLNRIN